MNPPATPDSGPAGDPADDHAPAAVVAAGNEHGTESLRRLAKRTAMAGACGFMVLVLAAVGLVLERQATYNGNVARIPDALPTGTQRPADRAPRGTENWVLTGSPTRVGAARPTDPAAPPADSVMLVHFPAGQRKVYLISFPRDVEVDVPAGGRHRLKDVITVGGPSLLVASMERLTGVRIDHFAALDFDGFETMTDAVGGVRIAGQHLDGSAALRFVRGQDGASAVDGLDRIERQRLLIRAVADRVGGDKMVTNPLRLNSFLQALTDSISVDDGVSAGKLRSLALEIGGIDARGLVFVTVPTREDGRDGRELVLDDDSAAALFTALRTGTMAGHRP